MRACVRAGRQRAPAWRPAQPHASASATAAAAARSVPLELASATTAGTVRLHRQQQRDQGGASCSGAEAWQEAAAFQAAPNVACMVRRRAAGPTACQQAALRAAHQQGHHRHCHVRPCRPWTQAAPTWPSEGRGATCGCGAWARARRCSGPRAASRAGARCAAQWQQQQRPWQQQQVAGAGRHKYAVAGIKCAPEGVRHGVVDEVAYFEYDAMANFFWRAFNARNTMFAHTARCTGCRCRGPRITSGGAACLAGVASWTSRTSQPPLSCPTQAGSW